MDRYNTLSQSVNGYFKEKGSKFFSYLAPVENEEEALNFLDSIKEEHFKARHHCSAWRVNPDELIERSNDDGEPSGTAGKPILGQLIKYDVVNIVAVVVRYFGGTLLGTSGLIQAYKTSTQLALESGNIIEVVQKTPFKIVLPLAKVHILEEWAAQLNTEIISRSYEGTNAIYSMEAEREAIEGKLKILKSKLLNIYIEEVEEKMEYPDIKFEILG
ncbi:IMPACT family protein [Membranihabitans maritimus]|uniref:IMPACT family protein n=1 Tax=Membranihabitans maritimus TaxID=2904244 RepID=UPI001F16318E|nr:YigZ family protein [Membranihabitans maritimus]